MPHTVRSHVQLFFVQSSPKRDRDPVLVVKIPHPFMELPKLPSPLITRGGRAMIRCRQPACSLHSVSPLPDPGRFDVNDPIIISQWLSRAVAPYNPTMSAVTPPLTLGVVCCCGVAYTILRLPATQNRIFLRPCARVCVWVQTYPHGTKGNEL